MIKIYLLLFVLLATGAALAQPAYLPKPDDDGWQRLAGSAWNMNAQMSAGISFQIRWDKGKPVEVTGEADNVNLYGRFDMGKPKLVPLAAPYQGIELICTGRLVLDKTPGVEPNTSAPVQLRLTLVANGATAEYTIAPFPSVGITDTQLGVCSLGWQY